MDWADKVWTVADVMVEDVVTVAPATPYRHLVELLWIHGISGLPVVDEGGALVGIVSESDMLRREELRGRTAADYMTAPVVTVSPETGLAEAAARMRSRALKRLPVVTADGRLAGIVSRADLLKVFLRSGETLEWDVAEVVRRHLGESGSITAQVSEGIIRLEGVADSPAQADQLVAALQSLPGVVAVDDRLTRPVAASPS